MTKEQKFLLLAVLIVAGIGVTYYVTQNNSQVATAEQGASTNQVTTETKPQVVTQNYKSNIAYKIPNGSSETIHVGITLTDGVISDITFTTDTPGHDISKAKIAAFTQALNNGADLKGKKLSEVSVVRLGGASLTSSAFMEAIGQIRAQING